MGTIEDWVMEGHRLAQTVAYGDLDGQNPALITASYERQADPVILGSTGKGRREAGLPLEHSLEVKYLANVRRTSGVRTI